MSPLRILVSGGGIAGPTTAYWLARAGAQVVVVERAPSLRTVGQTIDVRGPGLEVVRRMGLEDAVRSKTTQEQGIAFVDANGRIKAEFGVDLSGQDNSFTSETEILRGELSKILYEASLQQNVKYMFGNAIKNIVQEEDRLQVDFTKDSHRQAFDLVVAADGMGSSTRSLAFDNAGKSPLQSLGQYTSYFTIPYKESDGTWSRWYNAPGGRCILLRPDGGTATRAFLSIMSTSETLQNHGRLSVDEQKKLIHGLFEDAGWEASRVLAGMDDADDFYMQQITQVKMDKSQWTQGRVALVGDAGYCPSPISGVGTSLAITGAYILAGEIARHGEDYKAAFAAYEQLMRPRVDKAQSLPPGAPALANPQTAWGISILNGALGFVSWSGLVTLIQKLPSWSAGDPPLPEYDL